MASTLELLPLALFSLSAISLPTLTLDGRFAEALVLVAAFFLCRTVYRLYLHPLSHLKGPAVAAATSWWIYLVDRTGYSEERFAELHQIYQTRALRIGPNEVHITDPEQYATIYHGSRPFQKDPFFYGMFPAQDAMAVMATPARHDGIRRRLNPAFARAHILSEVQPLISQHLEHLMRKLTAVSGNGPVVLYDAVRCVTMDIISEFCLGRSPNLVDKDPQGFNAQWLRIFDKENYILAEFRYWPFILQLATALPRALMEATMPKGLNFFDFLDYTSKAILDFKARLGAPKSQEGSRKPVFGRMGDRSVDELTQEAITFLAGGSDPTAACIIQGVTQLVQEPAYAARLRAELDAAMPGSRDHRSLLELEQLPFLSACVKESIRFGNPVPGRLPRVVPQEGLIVDGQLIPGDSIVGMSSTHMHNEPTVWGPDAARFRPERWLETVQPHELERHLTAFSKGKRMCIGINLAHAEIYMVLATLFRHFEIAFAAPERLAEQMRCPDFFTRTYVGGGPRVIMRPRAV